MLWCLWTLTCRDFRIQNKILFAEWKEIEGTLFLRVEKFLWHFSQVCGCILWNFMRALHFSSHSFYGGPVPIIFLNDFIFKYEIVIMRKGSLSPELHCVYITFSWLMWKQLPHQELQSWAHNLQASNGASYCNANYSTQICSIITQLRGR